MKMPLEKTWCRPFESKRPARQWYDVEIPSLMYWFKEALVNASVGAWTVVASSNTSVVGLYDTWTSWEDVICQNSMNDTYINPGSWMILKSPTGTKGPYWFIMALSDDNYDRATPTRFWITKSEPDLSNMVTYRLPPFTGPAASGACVVQPGSSGGNSQAYIIDVVVANDGSFFMFVRYGVSDVDGSSSVSSLLIFNIMEETPRQDTFGAFFFAKDDITSTLDLNSSVWNDGIGLDPDGTQITLSMVRNYPTSQDGTTKPNQSILHNEVEDPYYNKYASEQIRTYCTTSGKKSYRGRLSDVWWCPRSLVLGTPAFLDRDTRVCSVGGSGSAFWIPCPGDPFRL